MWKEPSESLYKSHPSCHQRGRVLPWRIGLGIRTAAAWVHPWPSAPGLVQWVKGCGVAVAQIQYLSPGTSISCTAAVKKSNNKKKKKKEEEGADLRKNQGPPRPRHCFLGICCFLQAWKSHERSPVGPGCALLGREAVLPLSPRLLSFSPWLCIRLLLLLTAMKLLR